MSEFIESIGRCYLNNVGFDLYRNKDGSATIRPVTRGREWPRKHWIKLESVESWEKLRADLFEGAAGVDLVDKMKKHFLDL